MSKKLYGAYISPYVAKVLILAEAKGLDLEMVSPPGGTGSEEYKALNPTGKVPALEADGAVLPESTAILHYLDQTEAGPKLLPEDPIKAAQVLAVTQIADLYVGENLGALFGQMNPKTRSEDITKARLEGLLTGLSRLDKMIDGGSHALGGQISFADCAIAPYLFYVTQVLGAFGVADPLADAPKVKAYWDAIQKDDAVAPVLAKMTEALAAMRSGS